MRLFSSQYAMDMVAEGLTCEIGRNGKRSKIRGL